MDHAFAAIDRRQESDADAVATDGGHTDLRGAPGRRPRALADPRQAEAQRRRRDRPPARTIARRLLHGGPLTAQRIRKAARRLENRAALEELLAALPDDQRAAIRTQMVPILNERGLL